MRIEDFMTRRVVTVTPDTSILAAAKLMLENHISGLPVVDTSAHVVGIISESDLLRDDGKGVDGSPWLQMMVGPDALSGEPAQLSARRVGDVMTRGPVTVAPNASIAQACRLMEQHGIKRLPVVAKRHTRRPDRARRPGAGLRPVHRKIRTGANPGCQHRFTLGRTRTADLAQPRAGDAAVLTISSSSLAMP